MAKTQNNRALLSNAPCKEDLFEGKAHQRLAQTIADELQSKAGCPIIGIDGEWGSGKSNLLGIVEDLLQKEDKVGEPKRRKENEKERFHFYTYDAWKHQTDLPRRTVLEELTKDLVDVHKILAEDNWQTRLKELLAKKKSTNTITVPSLGIGTIVSITAIFLTPFITHLASLIKYDWLKMMVYIVPYAIAYVWAFLAHVKKVKKQWGKKYTFLEYASTFFLIYKDQIKENTTYETISEEEASSDQFKDWFSDIDAALKEKNTILVLVIDNMDRLPKEKVRELWAVALTFFAEAAYSNIRMIVPFDRTHLRCVFQTENVNQEEGKNPETPIIYADDFINKTFSVVYCVPPPIMTEWMQYFKDKWKEAFGKDVEADNSVLQIYDMLTTSHTPRKIIAFINQFVTIKRNCDPEIEDKYIALYLLGRDAIAKSPLDEILKPSYLGGLDFLYGSDPKMPECISALHYQLPIEAALDIIFVREVTRELDGNKINRLASLKGSSKYWAILNKAVTNVVNVENATLALDAHFEEESDEINSLWDTLCYIDIKASTHAYYKEYHKVLMSHTSKKERYYSHLVTQYRGHINDNDFDIENYMVGIDELRKLRGTSKGDPILSFKTKIKPEDYLFLVTERKEKSSEYGLTVNAKGFDEYLVNLSEDEIASLKIYPYTKDVVKTPNYVNKVKDLFKTKYNNIALEGNLIDRIKEVENRPFDITTYWDMNKLQIIARTVKSEDKLFPDFLAIILATWSGGVTHTNIRNTHKEYLDSTDEKLVTSVAKTIENYMNYGTLLLNLPAYNPQKLAAAVAKELTINEYGESRMNVKNVLSSFEKILDSSDIEPSELINRINDKDTQDLSFDDVETLPIRLYVESQNIDNELTRHCLGLAKDYLQQTSQEEWKESLLSSKKDFRLELLKVYHPIKLQLCFDAFKALMRDYAIGVSSNRIPEENVATMICICKNLHRNINPVFTEIRNVFIKNSNITLNKLKYFGPWLLEYGRLGDNPDSLEKIFHSEFLNDEEIVEMLITNAATTKLMVDKAKNPDDFRDTMSALLNTKYKDNDDFKNLCDTLGIN